MAELRLRVKPKPGDRDPIAADYETIEYEEDLIDHYNATDSEEGKFVANNYIWWEIEKKAQQFSWIWWILQMMRMTALTITYLEDIQTLAGTLHLIHSFFLSKYISPNKLSFS